MNNDRRPRTMRDITPPPSSDLPQYRPKEQPTHTSDWYFYEMLPLTRSLPKTFAIGGSHNRLQRLAHSASRRTRQLYRAATEYFTPAPESDRIRRFAYYLRRNWVYFVAGVLLAALVAGVAAYAMHPAAKHNGGGSGQGAAPVSPSQHPSPTPSATETPSPTATPAPMRSGTGGRGSSGGMMGPGD